MGYLCSDFLKSTVMCFLRPIVQFELTFVGDCACPASSVASLAALGRLSDSCRGDVPVWFWGMSAPSTACCSTWARESGTSRPFWVLLFVGLWNCTCWFQYCSFVPYGSFFLSSESFWLWICFRKSDKLSILSAYITHENKWWLCIYIVQNIFIHFNIAQILNYLKVFFPFFQELCLSLKQGYHLNYCSFIKSHSFECFMYFVAIFLNIYCKCTLQF